MRKRLVTLATALGVIMALSIPVGAADLHDAHDGSYCTGAGDGILQLHFVNNKIPVGASAGWLTVILDGGATTIELQSIKVNRRTQQWTVPIGGNQVLTDAYTTTVEGGNRETQALAGMLVLSDYVCKKSPKTIREP